MAKASKKNNKENQAEAEIILIVEDDKYTRLIIEKLLTKSNYKFYSAVNGKEALDIIEKVMPKVIIADWNMPVLNGLELCKTIKKNDKLKMIYFILFTAKISLADRVEGLDSGADDFLIKPTENEELLARVRTGIRIANLQSELTKIEHDKALIEIACTIGHKLSNPLNSFTFSLKSLLDKLSKKDLVDLNEELSIIKLSVEKMKVLVNELNIIEKPELTDYSPDIKMLKMD
ncbi:response regulator MprA [bacterium BMS3Abin03]|nr:response regulator MprA [bacterium BMS3Abin03]